MITGATVEEYILKSGRWQEILMMLREVMLSLELEETVKWHTPVYCDRGKNIVGLAAFKTYAGLWFYQGVFLKDNNNKLLTAPDGEAKAQRQWRFLSADQVEEDLELIISYTREAIENSRAGKVVKPEFNKPFEIPKELDNALKKEPELKIAFELLSHAKRRDYARFIGQAKKTETRIKRLERSIPAIREGKSFMDMYMNK